MSFPWSYGTACPDQVDKLIMVNLSGVICQDDAWRPSDQVVIYRGEALGSLQCRWAEVFIISMFGNWFRRGTDGKDSGERLVAALEEIAQALGRIALALDSGSEATATTDPGQTGLREGPGAVAPAGVAAIVRQAPVNDAVSGGAWETRGGSKPIGDSGAARFSDLPVGCPERESILLNFLDARGIKVTLHPAKDEVDAVLDRLSQAIGLRYASIAPFYSRLKSNLSDGRAFTLNLKNEPLERVSDICQVAQELYRLAFLEEYLYRKSPHFLLHARPSRLPRAINFMTGGWLERHALNVVRNTVLQAGAQDQFSFLLNPQVRLPGGETSEFDLIFEAGGQPIWIELKTGDYQRHIAKYGKVSRMLGLEVGRCLMVLPEISEDVAMDLSVVYGMTVLPIHRLQPVIEGLLASGTAGRPVPRTS